MIPRIIHQIWVGNRPRPAWMSTWQNIPGWRYELWSEDRIRNCGLPNRAVYKTYLAAGKPWGAADVARVDILARHGGVYIDADTEFVRDFADEPFMAGDGFLVRCPNPGYEDGVINGVMGAARGCRFITDYQAAISHADPEDLHPACHKVGGTVATRVHQEGNYPGIALLPATSFLHLTKHGIPLGPIEYAVHYYGSTRGLYGGDAT